MVGIMGGCQWVDGSGGYADKGDPEGPFRDETMAVASLEEEPVKRQWRGKRGRLKDEE